MRTYSIKIYTLFLCFISCGLMWSCDEEEQHSSEVVLLSFGPAGVMHGDTIVFIGENLQKVDTVELGGAVMVLKDAFLSQTSERIELRVPDAAETGKVILHTTDGTVTSKTLLNFEVVFTISGMTPEARPGSTVTFEGNYLSWVEEVRFQDDLPVTVFENQSLTQLVVQVPQEARSGPLTLVGGGMYPHELRTSLLTVTLPAATALNPSGVRHSGQLTIEGANLDLTKEVVFPGGSVISDFISVSSSSLVVQVPNTATDGQLILVAHSLVEVPTPELTIILPRESTLSPNPAIAGGELTITGADLDLVASLIFPAVSVPVSTFISQSDTEIKVTIPDDASSGFLKFVTIHEVQVPMTISLQIAGLEPLLYTVYSDALENGWQDWGWGGARDYANTEVVFDGASSIRKTYDGTWDAVFLGGGSVATGDYETFVIYAYGGSSAAANVQLVVNSSSTIAFMVPPGEWTEVQIPVADVGIATWTDLMIQGQGTSGVVYFDYIGFR